MLSEFQLLLICAVCSFVTMILIFILFSIFNNKGILFSVNKKDHPIFNLKLQAYERMLLFLSRIKPNELINIEIPRNADIYLFHIAMITRIKQEFSHNLAQKLYVSFNTWQAIEELKEKIMMDVNRAVSDAYGTMSISDVKINFISNFNENTSSDYDKVVLLIKNEMQKELI